MATTHSRADPPDDREVRYRRLIQVGIALTTERNHKRLMEMILLEAKQLSQAEGGTIYLLTQDGAGLSFEIMRNDVLSMAMGGTTGRTIPFPPLRLHDAAGAPNHRNVATYAALSGHTVSIADAYEVGEFDFEGTRAFDARTGYRSISFLAVPLKNHQGDVIGVIQLINARAPGGGVTAFPAEIVPLIEALAGLAAVALDNQMLIEAQKTLFKALVQLIAGAIDAKSPYTGGHCRRVPELVAMLAQAAHDTTEGPFSGFALADDEWYELEVAAGLHDCGKVTTPEYVVDKATKLETIYNRIHEIRTRFEVVKRDVEIEYLKAVLAGGDEAALAAARDARLAGLDQDFAFVAGCNIGGESMSAERVERLRRIAGITWVRTLDDSLGLSADETRRWQSQPVPPPAREPLLADKPRHLIPHVEEPVAADNPWGFKIKPPAHRFNLGELHNLSVRAGTLTAEDRFHINDHILQTVIMLEGLPFPRHLERVPEWAYNHHEKMDGTGYPRGLSRDQMSIPARMMAIADIFEALTASDRPYKPRKTLSEAIGIMARMVRDQHIDPDLFELFLVAGIHRRYAETFLSPDQIDEVEIARYLRPQPQPAAQGDGLKRKL
ncbi:MAG: HD domain-containing phosphohydrolase [Rhodospirillaceae bacterium]